MIGWCSCQSFIQWAGRRGESDRRVGEEREGDRRPWWNWPGYLSSIFLVAWYGWSGVGGDNKGDITRLGRMATSRVPPANKSVRRGGEWRGETGDYQTNQTKSGLTGVETRVTWFDAGPRPCLRSRGDAATWCLCLWTWQKRSSQRIGGGVGKGLYEWESKNIDYVGGF